MNLDSDTAHELLRAYSSSVLLHVHRDHKDHQGREAQDGHLDCHTAPELCYVTSRCFWHIRMTPLIVTRGTRFLQSITEPLGHSIFYFILRIKQKTNPSAQGFFPTSSTPHPQPLCCEGFVFFFCFLRLLFFKISSRFLIKHVKRRLVKNKLKNKQTNKLQTNPSYLHVMSIPTDRRKKQTNKKRTTYLE